MIPFIARASPTVLRPLPKSTAGDLALVLIRVATTEDLEGDKSRSREPAVRQCSSRALQPVLRRPGLSRPEGPRLPYSSRAQHPLLKQSLSHPEKLVLAWSSRELRLVPRLPGPSHPDKRSVLDVRGPKACRVPRHLAGPAPALKRGSSVTEDTKALAPHRVRGRHPAARAPLPMVEVPAVALHKAAAMATHTAGAKGLDTNSLWRIE